MVLDERLKFKVIGNLTMEEKKQCFSDLIMRFSCIYVNYRGAQHSIKKLLFFKSGRYQKGRGGKKISLSLKSSKSHFLVKH